MDTDVEAAAIFNRPRTVDRRKVGKARVLGRRAGRPTNVHRSQSGTPNNPNLTVVLFTFRMLKMSSKVQPSSRLPQCFLCCQQTIVQLSDLFLVRSIYCINYLWLRVFKRCVVVFALYLPIFFVVSSFFFLPLLQICQSIWHFLITEYLFYVDLPL